MRKILTPEELDKRRNRRVRIMSVILLLVMVFSTVGFAFLTAMDNSGNSDKVENNSNSGSNVVSFGNANLSFIYDSASVGDIPVSLNLGINDYYQRNIYLSADNDGVKKEISSTLGRYVSRLQEACYGKCELDLPEKTCSDFLIVWKEKNENRVYQQDNCTFIEGDLKAVDAFLYSVFGIN